MKTMCIQIGNSDDKLTQYLWSRFCLDIEECCKKYAREIHFSGYSNPNKRFQNACFVLSRIPDLILIKFKNELISIRRQYNQDSIAIFEGDVNFI